MEHSFEQKLNESSESKEKQIIEGMVDDINYPEKSLPNGITKDQVVTFIDHKGKWRWHLKPDFIEDKEESERFKEELNKWAGL